MYKLQDINNEFKLPIMYTEKKNNIDEHLIEDLELVEFKDNSNNSIYHYIFNPEDNFSKITTKMWAKQYSYDEDFLNDSRNLYETFIPNKSVIFEEDKRDIENMWGDIKNDLSFKTNYQYVEWTVFEKLNYSSIFLFIMSIYSISSPILSLMTPIFFLIIPFILLKLQNIPITIEKYTEVVKQMFSRHAIGKMFGKFNGGTMNEKVYLLAMFAFYLYQIYQNTCICIRYYLNMTKIHNYLNILKKYLSYTLESMDNLLVYTKDLNTYTKFNNDLEKNKNILMQLNKQVCLVKPFSFSLQKFFQIGEILKLFYRIREDSSINKVMVYSFGLNGYIENIKSLQKQIFINENINFCSITDKKTKFTEAYYPPLLDALKNIKNTYDINKNYIITGPNAAGKTTFIKTTILNIIFSQQICAGFYTKADVSLYQQIHCYINIPDTSGRDSLFQAEARRCKDILDMIENNPDDKHFCIFDELYSGTNPYEATASAYGYLKYLSKLSNVKFILTTHFIDLCKDIEKVPNIRNYHMKSQLIKSKIKYKYLLARGISTIKGGIQVLYDLYYPKKIIDLAEEHLNALK